ncbi:MAG: hypothetical protein ACREFC_04560, partial [Stellaceae bacterium]
MTRGDSWVHAAAAFLQYQHWIWRYDRLSAADRRAIAEHAKRRSLPRLIVIIRIDAASLPYATAMLSRLEASLFPDWKALLSISADCPPVTIGRVAAGLRDNPKIRFMSDGRADALDDV